ncbi:MAG: hypothetical protein ACE5G1_06865 [bacterium]
MYLHALAQRLIVFDKDRITLFDGTYQDFLDRVGWQDEAEVAGSGQPAPESNSAGRDRKTLKKLKAELIQEKARVLNPLQEQMNEIENAIERLEAELHANTQRLVKASSEGDIEAIASLPKKNSQLKPQIDKLYEQLDELNKKFDEKSLDFQTRLAGLN